MTTGSRGVCLVGGGLAAVSTAAELRSRGYEGRITMLCAEDDVPYDRPPLSKDVLLGNADPDGTALRPASWYADSGIELHTGTRVVALRPTERRVETADGRSLTAEAVVLATGGTPLRLPGGIAPPEHTLVLRTRADAERLRAALVPGVRALVIGAGLIGAEVASSAAALGAAVTLVDPVALPLEPVVGTLVARTLHGMHAASGVRVLRGSVAGIEALPDGGVAAAVEGPDGSVHVEAGIVVLGIGIAPDTALAASAGIPVERGVLVDDERRTGVPGVYAAGDAAQGRPGGRRPVRGEHWDSARLDGQAAAAAILGQALPAEGAPWFWSDRYGAHMEAVGHMAAAERTAVRGDPESGAFTVFGLRGGHCVAAAAIDRGTDIRAARRLIDRGVAAVEAALADESTPLKALLRR